MGYSQKPGLNKNYSKFILENRPDIIMVFGDRYEMLPFALTGYLNNIPISNNLKKLINLKKLDKISFISKGDDYQILFTANPSKFRIIRKNDRK